MTTTYLEPHDEGVKSLLTRKLDGPVIMLNLLRLRREADYAQWPELAPEEPISGSQALQHYIDHTLPFLSATGGTISLLGKGGQYLIGPENERWDAVMLIKQNTVMDFLNFAQNKDYMKGIGHRAAAVEDSRLLPLEEVAGF